MNEKVILVDRNDKEVGLMEKIEAHEKGLLHRAFSVFIFNEKGDLLLQQRSGEKYHSPKLWTNTCCSHQRKGEKSINAANRRLMEEVGLECDLTFSFKFIYKTPFDNGLTEHELDYVFIGVTSDEPQINTEEVMNYKYLSLDEIKKDVLIRPELYTSWFKICLPKLMSLSKF